MKIVRKQWQMEDSTKKRKLPAPTSGKDRRRCLEGHQRVQSRNPLVLWFITCSSKKQNRDRQNRMFRNDKEAQLPAGPRNIDNPWKMDTYEALKQVKNKCSKLCYH